MPLQLHAITALEQSDHRHLSAGAAKPIVFRDLAAIVTLQDRFALDEADDAAVAAHQAIVDGVFKTHVVLPTPVGIVFRTENVLTRWMELHYVTLTDALSFVNDRVAARVHVSRRGSPEERRETAGIDLAEAASDLFRKLRPAAVASVPVTMEGVTGMAISSAFLVERDRWTEFKKAVSDASRSGLAVDLTGPWAPYDFVRMQFND